MVDGEYQCLLILCGLKIVLKNGKSVETVRFYQIIPYYEENKHG